MISRVAGSTAGGRYAKRQAGARRQPTHGGKMYAGTRLQRITRRVSGILRRCRWRWATEIPICCVRGTCMRGTAPKRQPCAISVSNLGIRIRIRIRIRNEFARPSSPRLPSSLKLRRDRPPRQARRGHVRRPRRRITSATSATLYTRAKLHNTPLNPARYIYSQINNTALLCRAKSPKFPKFCVLWV